jgi:hypothetical protein
MVIDYGLDYRVKPDNDKMNHYNLSKTMTIS